MLSFHFYCNSSVIICLGLTLFILLFTFKTISESITRCITADAKAAADTARNDDQYDDGACARYNISILVGKSKASQYEALFEITS